MIAIFFFKNIGRSSKLFYFMAFAQRSDALLLNDKIEQQKNFTIEDKYFFSTIINAW